MDEREYRQNRSGKKKKGEGPISRYKRKMYGSINDPYCEAGMRVDPELFAQRDKERFNRFGDNSESEQANQPTVIEPEILFDAAEEIGLSYSLLGSSFQELSQELTEISSVSAESTAWWQSTMSSLPYLGGLVEPETGKLLLNIGDGKYALLRGDLNSIQDYMSLMRQYSPTTAFFLNYSLLSSFDSRVVDEAKDIMMGSRNSDLTDFIRAAKFGNVDINNQESEAVPLLNWMALQAGEQPTDVEKDENGLGEQTVFTAAISGDTVFVHPYSDGLVDNLIESIESIYQLVRTVPDNRQDDLEMMLEDELLDIINDDNRWGITDNDLQRMTDEIERLQSELEQTITSLSAETETEEPMS